MKLVRFALGSFNNGLSRRFHQPCMRTIFTNAPPGGGMDDNRNTNSFESPDDFERRIFGETSGDNSKPESFYEKLDRLGKTRDGRSSNLARGIGIGNGSHALDGLDESFTTLSDGMDEKLEEAATYFEMDDEEIDKEDYTFRPDVNFEDGMTYDIKDLDLTKRGVWREGPPKREEFEVTTKEVLRKADFRNVRFLANFITEAGILQKRSKFGISAKAQRKIAREIKTARAFGLMPFTTMGTKSFVFGRTMESLDQDYEYESYDNPTDDPYEKDPLEP